MATALIIFVVLPLVIANILHQALIVPRNYFQILIIPIDFGVKMGGKRILGDHKTVRGLLFVATMASLASALLSCVYPFPFLMSPAIFGAIIGCAYMLAELPNSFVKRRLGISEGARGEGKIGMFFAFFDHIDSVLGVVVALSFLAPLGSTILTTFIVLGALLHYVLERLLSVLGYRKASA